MLIYQVAGTMPWPVLPPMDPSDKTGTLAVLKGVTFAIVTVKVPGQAVPATVSFGVLVVLGTKVGAGSTK